MSAATFWKFDIRDRFTPLRTTLLGWIGSKAGKRNQFCQVTAAGFIDQAAAAGAVVATVRVGVLQNDIASSIAQASEEALRVGYRPIRETTTITLPLITSGTSFAAFVAPTGANVEDLVGLARMTDGNYAWDTTGTDYGKVVSVDTVRGLVTCTVLEAKRLA